MQVLYGPGVSARARVDILSFPLGASVGMATVKQTYDITPAGLVEAEEPLEVWTAARTLEGFRYDADVTLLKEEGTADLVVLGDALAPGEEAVASMTVSVTLGSRLHVDFRVTGDRTWWCSDYEEAVRKARENQPGPGDVADLAHDDVDTLPPAELPVFPPLPPDEDDGDEDGDDEDEEKEDPAYAASPPALFRRLPLDWTHAYGGASAYGMQYVDNPDGKGYVVEPTDAGEDPWVAGVPLPNVERADRPLVHWKQDPGTAGCAFYPMRFGLRLRRGMQPNPAGPGAAPRLLGSLFNQAHPDFILRGFPDGETLTVSGMTRDPEALSFAVRKPPLAAWLEEENARPALNLPLAWDLLCVTPERKRAYVTGRAAWTFHPRRDHRRNLRVGRLPSET